MIKTEENNYYYFDINSGYLKINCTNPVMLKHLNIFPMKENLNELTSGKRYYISNDKIKNNESYIFDNKLINETIKLKYTLFGLRPNGNVKLVFNNKKSYVLNNISLEVNYTFENLSENGFHFECENVENEHLLLAEIIVGFLSEEYNNDFVVKDFIDVFGTNTIEGNRKGIIIKIPKNYNDDLNDFSIILSN